MSAEQAQRKLAAILHAVDSSDWAMLLTEMALVLLAEEAYDNRCCHLVALQCDEHGISHRHRVGQEEPCGSYPHEIGPDAEPSRAPFSEEVNDLREVRQYAEGCPGMPEPVY